jgi:hypothetical protein
MHPISDHNRTNYIHITNNDQFCHFFSPCQNNPSKYNTSDLIGNKTKNGNAKAAALSDCNKPVGQAFYNL